MMLIQTLTLLFPLHYATLHYTALHYATPHYTTLHMAHESRRLAIELAVLALARICVKHAIGVSS